MLNFFYNMTKLIRCYLNNYKNIRNNLTGLVITQNSNKYKILK